MSTQVFWHVYFIKERSLLHNMSKVWLKNCLEPAQRCLGAACGSQNSGWEPLPWTVSRERELFLTASELNNGRIQEDKIMDFVARQRW